MKTQVLRLLSFLFVCYFSQLTVQAQDNVGPSENYTVRGIVIDSISDETLIGVNIFLRDTKYGTVTNADGFFELTAPEGNYNLIFSYIGYGQKELEISLKKNLAINISLNPAETPIEEVQITAQRRFFGNMDYGREIPTISAEVIEKQNSNNASDILHARLAGVWATKTSGAPGDHQKIRIRGQSSFFSSAEPLYVVDGVPVPIVNLSSLGIADLNIHDIENITVLKDASSSSLYGFQGGNGVVLIDTKKGGENRINFLTRFGYQWQPERYDLMNTRDFLTSLDSARSILGSGLRSYYPRYEAGLCSDDWQDVIFSQGSSQEYQLSASGSVKSLNYYISGNYTDQTGILSNSQYSRTTFSARISRKFFKKLVIDIGYRGSWQTNKNNQDEYKGNRLIFEGISKASCLRCTPDSLLYDEYDNLNSRTYYSAYTRLSDPTLPESIIENNQHALEILSQIVNLSARFQINDHLHMDLMESFMNRPSLYNLQKNSSQIVLKTDENVILFNHQVNLSYNNTFKNNQVGILLAHRFYKDNLWWKVDSLQGTLPDHYTLRNSMAAYGTKGSVIRNMSSYILHLSYNYRKTWFLSLVANLSHVKEGLYTDYYTLFPSVALSWDIIQQFNLEKTKWLNDLELYVNWGQSGNYPLNGLANDLYEDVSYAFDSVSSYAPAVSQLVNHNLKHENTRETDLGIKSSFLENRFSLHIVYYMKNIMDIILLRDIPYYYGGGKQYINLGEVAISGYEASLDLVPLKTRFFEWDLLLNYSFSEQVVKKLIEDQDISFTDSDVLFPDFHINEGDPLGNIYGYKYLGKMHPEDWEGDHNDFITVQREKYLNADSSDTDLDADDKIVLGNALPDFTVNLISSFSFKNFNLDFTWYAVSGVSKYNATRAATVMTGVNRKVNDYIADTLRSITTKYFYESDVFVEDASFIRLKTLTLGYNFHKIFAGRLNLHLSVSFNNLLTFTRYSGYDPEATIFTDNNFSDNAVDRGAYANPKSFYITLKMEL